MKKYFLLLVVLLIGINIHQGTEYNLYDIDKCYGNAEVKVRLKLNDTIDYAIKDCNYDGEIWQCKCTNKNTPIILQTRDYSNNSYYISLQYQIKPTVNDNINNENNKRIKNFNNINVGYYPEVVTKKGFKFNNVSLAIVISVVVIFIIGLVLLLIYLYRYFKEDSEEEINELEFKTLSDKWKLDDIDKPINDEYEELVNKYRKVSITPPKGRGLNRKV